jgi:hypothetical protein
MTGAEPAISWLECPRLVSVHSCLVAATRQPWGPWAQSGRLCDMYSCVHRAAASMRRHSTTVQAVGNILCQLHRTRVAQRSSIGIAHRVVLPGSRLSSACVFGHAGPSWRQAR